MDIIGYERSRALRLANAFRPQGAPFAPEVFAKIIQRYSFAKYPTIEDLQKEGPSLFQIGKFQDVQIDEFGVYVNGYAAAGRCSTDLLDAFLDDAAAWAAQEVGLNFILPHRQETYYETNIVVQSTVDLASIVRPHVTDAIAEVITKTFGVQYVPAGVIFDSDPDTLLSNKIKRWRLSIERRAGFSFKENIFLCQAPLSTPELVKLLEGLEQALTERRM